MMLKKTIGSGRIGALDGVRGLAIALVMLGHANFLRRPGIDSFLGEIVHMGWVGIEFFFVLSGFLITGILIDERDHPHYFRDFYARRILRIFPLYYLFLFLVLFLLPGLGFDAFKPYEGPTFYYWLYISNIGMSFFHLPHHPFLLLTWTLSIEEQFYLVWPFVVFAAGPKRLIKVSLWILCGSFLMRLVMLACHVPTEPIYTFTLTRLDGLAIGSALAVLLRQKEATLNWMVTARRLMIGSLILILLIRVGDEWIQPALSDYKGPLMQSVGYTALALFFGSLLVLVVSEGRLSWARFFNSRILRFLGKYSYAMYLLHMPIVYATKDAFRTSGLARSLTIAHSQILPQIAYDIFLFVSVSLVALASWHLWEKHFLKLKAYFPYKREGDEKARPPS